MMIGTIDFHYLITEKLTGEGIVIVNHAPGLNRKDFAVLNHLKLNQKIRKPERSRLKQKANAGPALNHRT